MKKGRVIVLLMTELGRLDSNQDPQIQSLVCCHCTTPHR